MRSGVGTVYQTLGTGSTVSPFLFSSSLERSELKNSPPPVSKIFGLMRACVYQQVQIRQSRQGESSDRFSKGGTLTLSSNNGGETSQNGSRDRLLDHLVDRRTLSGSL